MKRMVFKKPNWGPPPEGYIAGLGRGATGFVTRADIGGARIGQNTFTDSEGRSVAADGKPGGNSKGPMGPPGLGKMGNNRKDAPSNDAQFDDWNGFEGDHVGGTKIF